MLSFKRDWALDLISFSSFLCKFCSLSRLKEWLRCLKHREKYNIQRRITQIKNLNITKYDWSQKWPYFLMGIRLWKEDGFKTLCSVRTSRFHSLGSYWPFQISRTTYVRIPVKVESSGISTCEAYGLESKLIEN